MRFAELCQRANFSRIWATVFVFFVRFLACSCQAMGFIGFWFDVCSTYISSCQWLKIHLERVSKVAIKDAFSSWGAGSRSALSSTSLTGTRFGRDVLFKVVGHWYMTGICVWWVMIHQLWLMNDEWWMIIMMIIMMMMMMLMDEKWLKLQKGRFNNHWSVSASRWDVTWHPWPSLDIFPITSHADPSLDNCKKTCLGIHDFIYPSIYLFIHLHITISTLSPIIMAVEN